MKRSTASRCTRSLACAAAAILACLSPLRMHTPPVRAAHVDSQWGPQDRRTSGQWVARDGDFSLDVTTHGDKSMPRWQYRLKQGQKTQWQNYYDFLPTACVVTRDGTAAGCGNTRPAGSVRSKGLCLFIFAPDGAVRLLEENPMRPSRYVDMPPEPRVFRLLVHPDAGRMFVAIADPEYQGDERTDNWRIYDLATGKCLRKYKPRMVLPNPGVASRMTEAHCVPGTPLIVAHWIRAEDIDGKTANGSLYALLDRDGKLVWLVERSDDLTFPDAKGVDFMAQAMALKGWQLPEPRRPGRFEIGWFGDATIVEHAVEKSPDGKWNIHECGRRRFSAWKAATQPAATPDAGTNAKRQ